MSSLRSSTTSLSWQNWFCPTIHGLCGCQTVYCVIHSCGSWLSRGAPGSSPYNWRLGRKLCPVCRSSSLWGKAAQLYRNQRRAKRRRRCMAAGVLGGHNLSWRSYAHGLWRLQDQCHHNDDEAKRRGRLLRQLWIFLVKPVQAAKSKWETFSREQLTLYVNFDYYCSRSHAAWAISSPYFVIDLRLFLLAMPGSEICTEGYFPKCTILWSALIRADKKLACFLHQSSILMKIDLLLCLYLVNLWAKILICPSINCF